VPWWYFHGLPDQPGQAPASTRLPRLDPGARLWNDLGVQRAIGCVVTSPNEVPTPGTVRNNATVNTFVFGEPDNTLSPRLQAIVDTLQRGLPGASASTAIREAVWSKVMLNLTSSTLAALTMRPPIELSHDEALLKVYRQLLDEGVAVAAACGVTVAADAEARITRMRTVRHPPSMLQDLLAGRPLEIDALLLAVQDLARQGDVPTPVLDILLALLRQRVQAGV
jgi:2-dehydropantoate 2-reductase